MLASYKNLSLLQYYTPPQLSRFYSAVKKNQLNELSNANYDSKYQLLKDFS
jgi:hypothetical protein